jgi:H+/Cl- antiporter ClcA
VKVRAARIVDRGARVLGNPLQREQLCAAEAGTALAFARTSEGASGRVDGGRLVPVALASATAAAMRRYIMGLGPLFPVPAHPIFIGPQGLLGCVLAGVLAGADRQVLKGVLGGVDRQRQQRGQRSICTR